MEKRKERVVILLTATELAALDEEASGAGQVRSEAIRRRIFKVARQPQPIEVPSALLDAGASSCVG